MSEMGHRSRPCQACLLLASTRRQTSRERGRARDAETELEVLLFGDVAIEGINHLFVSTYPRLLRRPYRVAVSIHEGRDRLRQSLRIGGGGRGMRNEGCQTYTPPRRPKLHGPGSTGSGHGALAASCAPAPNSRASRPAPKRWVGFQGDKAKSRKHGNLKKTRHRGSCGASLKHRARDAGGNGGLAALQSGGGSIKPPSCFGAARHRGPWVRQDPGVPRRPHFGRRRLGMRRAPGAETTGGRSVGWTTAERWSGNRGSA
jgi:hypothetical protein